MARAYTFLLLLVAAVSGLPSDPILRKLDSKERYTYMQDDEGKLHLIDLWMTADDISEALRFDPDRQNVYHLFTRANPSISQPLLVGNEGLLGLTNYDAIRRTIVLIHGWMGTATGSVNAVLVPAFLAAEDVNVIVVDWSAGAGTINYAGAVSNTRTSGESVARFLNWLNAATGAVAEQYHLVGHSLGGHQVGIVARNVDGDVGYVTGLDPALPGWITNDHKLRAEDSKYTEVIHTNAGLLGYLGTLGHVDFYPNGGINMPGCSSQDCDHSRCYHYLAESLTSGVFTGRRCATVVTAMTGTCILWGNLNMGGLVPKTGQSGIFHLETNAAPPFARG